MISSELFITCNSMINFPTLRLNNSIQLLASTGLRKCRAIHVCALTTRQPICSEDDTSVVSIANWAPPYRGRPSATTSRRRPSWPTTGRFKSRTKTFVETRAPHGKSEQLRSPQRNHDLQEHPPSYTLLGDGHGRRRDGHIGRCAK